jgi:hypothetical protein
MNKSLRKQGAKWILRRIDDHVGLETKLCGGVIKEGRGREEEVQDMEGRFQITNAETSLAGLDGPN